MPFSKVHPFHHMRLHPFPHILSGSGSIFTYSMNAGRGRGLGYALDLGLELIRLLQGPQQAQKIAAAIQYSRG